LNASQQLLQRITIAALRLEDQSCLPGRCAHWLSLCKRQRVGWEVRSDGGHADHLLRRHTKAGRMPATKITKIQQIHFVPFVSFVTDSSRAFVSFVVFVADSS
jgi:hypothetical protein